MKSSVLSICVSVEFLEREVGGTARQSHTGGLLFAAGLRHFRPQSLRLNLKIAGRLPLKGRWRWEKWKYLVKIWTKVYFWFDFVVTSSILLSVLTNS